MKPFEIIQQLETDNSRLFKESVILDAAQSQNDEFFNGLKYCLDALTTFGVKQLPVAKIDGPGITWDDFEGLLIQLRDRDLTGHAARDAIQTMMELSIADEWNFWYRRILDKNLKCGVNEKTVNNVVDKQFNQYHVPVFSVQLAHDSAKHESKVKGKKLIDIKYDGVRIVSIVYPNGHVCQYSRNGKEFINFPQIRNQLGQMSIHLDQPYVFDGEIMGSNFQALMKQLYRKDNVVTNDSVLYLFDMIPLVDFQRGKCEIPQYERLEKLHNWYGRNIFLALANYIQVVNQELVDLDTAEGNIRFKQLNETAIAGGFEGIMLKDPDAPYELKRSVAWLKKKPVISVDLVVFDVVEGTGKYEGMMGAFSCNGIDDGRLIDVSCGSGFSDEQRGEYWINKRDIIGKTVEIMADAITQNQDLTYSLRFPRFAGFRHDK